MTSQVIELSNSSYNGTSSLLSTIVLIAFIYFTIASASRLYDKLNPNARYKDPNIINALSQNTMETVQYLMGGIVADNIDTQVEKYKIEINNLSDTIKESQNFAGKVMILISALNKRIYDQFESKLNSFSTFFENTKTTANQIKNAIDNLNKNYQDLSKYYQTRLRAYVDNLISFMGKVSEQITKATVIPALFNMIEPLKKIYNSIYGTLQNNLTFIRDIYKDDKYNIPKNDYSSTAQSALNTGFGASKSILTMAGYK